MELRERFGLIRAHYKKYAEVIASVRDEWAVDAYAWDVRGTGISLTPIERGLWHDIRAVPAILYPQYPVGRFFVDFGNPAAKVAIECDGHQWHIDAEKDAKRQKEIESMGWSVYRISGSDCLKDTEEVEDECGSITVRRSNARLFIEQIANRHHIKRGSFT